MKIIETSRGRLVLSHRAVLSELAMLMFMLLFGALAMAVMPVDYWLSMAMFGIVLLGAMLFMIVAVRTTVIFDRIQNVVLIRRKSVWRLRERAVPLAEVTSARLLSEGLEAATGSGVVALELRPGAPRQTVPLMPDALPKREAAETLGAINAWLGGGEGGAGLHA